LANVLIVAYLLIVLALIAVILLQRSEGGGLGMGGGNSNGLMTVRGSANLLTRTTAILATLFFATAIGLTILTEIDRGTQSILQRAADSVGEGASAPTTVLDALNSMQAEDTGLAVPDALPATDATPATTDTPVVDPGLAVPATDTPAAPADAAPADQPAAETTPEAPVN
jgi:preprotein translocase subunit SecG